MADLDEEPDVLFETECPLCGGEGVVDYIVDGINHHDGSLIERWRTCPQCNGSGTGLAASVPATEEEIMGEAAGYDPTIQPFDEPLRHVDREKSNG